MKSLLSECAFEKRLVQDIGKLEYQGQANADKCTDQGNLSAFRLSVFPDEKENDADDWNEETQNAPTDASRINGSGILASVVGLLELRLSSWLLV